MRPLASGRALAAVAISLALSGCGGDDVTSGSVSASGGFGSAASSGGFGGPQAGCGNGIFDAGEVCDDFNREDLSDIDTCSSDCRTNMILLSQGTYSTTWFVQYFSAGLLQSGVACIPTAGGQFPVLAMNHGGFAGFEGADPSVLCGELDGTDYVRVYAQYRGQPYPPYSVEGEPVDPSVSEGSVEVCLGEVNDVAALVRAVQRRPEIDKSAVYAAGASHGGCVSLQLAARAPQLGLPPLRAVTTLGAPTDFTALYAHLAEGEASDPELASWKAALDAAGGAPRLDPTRYAARSLVEQAAALVVSKTPVMLMHGIEDPLVPMSQACALHTKMRELGADAVDVQLDAAGEVVTEPLVEPACADVELAAVAPAAFDGPYYFVPLPGVGGSDTLELYQAFLGHVLAFSDVHPDAP